MKEQLQVEAHEIEIADDHIDSLSPTKHLLLDLFDPELTKLSVVTSQLHSQRVIVAGTRRFGRSGTWSQPKAAD